MSSGHINTIKSVHKHSTYIALLRNVFMRMLNYQVQFSSHLTPFKIHRLRWHWMTQTLEMVALFNLSASLRPWFKQPKLHMKQTYWSSLLMVLQAVWAPSGPLVLHVNPAPELPWPWWVSLRVRVPLSPQGKVLGASWSLHSSMHKAELKLRCHPKKQWP